MIAHYANFNIEKGRLDFIYTTDALYYGDNCSLKFSNFFLTFLCLPIMFNVDYLVQQVIVTKLHVHVVVMFSFSYRRSPRSSAERIHVRGTGRRASAYTHVIYL